MGFPNLIWMTSSVENIDLARKRKLELNEKSARLKMPMMGLELATPRLQAECSSH